MNDGKSDVVARICLTPSRRVGPANVREWELATDQAKRGTGGGHVFYNWRRSKRGAVSSLRKLGLAVYLWSCQVGGVAPAIEIEPAEGNVAMEPCWRSSPSHPVDLDGIAGLLGGSKLAKHNIQGPENQGPGSTFYLSHTYIGELGQRTCSRSPGAALLCYLIVHVPVQGKLASRLSLGQTCRTVLCARLLVKVTPSLTVVV